MGKTIIISSHILSELQNLCNRVAIIERGQLIYSGPVQGVRDQMAAGLIYWVTVSGDPTRAIEALKTRPEIADAVQLDGQIKITFKGHDVDPSILPDLLVGCGIKFTGLWEDELGLEEVFLRVTKGETQ
jgi:ABC-2 type transport system ATP-binding protein